LIEHPLFLSMGGSLRRGQLIEEVLEILGSGESISLVELGQRLSAPLSSIIAAACLLAKMNLVRLIP
jgi:hypothetical protein